MAAARPTIQYSTRVLAQQRLSSLTVGDLVRNFERRGDAATRLGYAKVLHREVPLRLARRVVGLAEGLPTAVTRDASFRALMDGHEQLLSTLTSFPYPTTPMEEREFTSFHRNLRRVYGQSFRFLHQSLKAGGTLQADEIVNTESALDAFFSSRITVRLMIDQLHLLNAPLLAPGTASTDKGVFDGEIRVEDVLQSVCDSIGTQLPPALGVNRLSVKSGDASAIFHVPGHVKSVVTSMLCNAVYKVGRARAAVAAANAAGGDVDLPAPMDVTLQCLKLDKGRVLVQIEDESGLMGKKEVGRVGEQQQGQTGQEVVVRDEAAVAALGESDFFRYTNRADSGGPLGAEANTLDDPILQAASRRLNSGELTSHSANNGLGLKTMAGLPQGWTMTTLGPRLQVPSGVGMEEAGAGDGGTGAAATAFLADSGAMGLPVARCLARHFRGDVMLGGDAGATMLLRLDSIDESFAL
jgi:hypothetical protein